MELEKLIDFDKKKTYLAMCCSSKIKKALPSMCVLAVITGNNASQATHIMIVVLGK